MQMPIGEVPEGSSADAEVRFRKVRRLGQVPEGCTYPGQIPEGSGTEVR